MKIDGKQYTGIWLDENNNETVNIIDQRFLPHRLEIINISNYIEMTDAIKEMKLRGAPLIGVAGAFAVYLALIDIRNEKFEEYELDKIIEEIINARPTAVNLSWAVKKIEKEIIHSDSIEEKIAQARNSALNIMNFEIESCKKIGEFGVKIIKDIYNKTQKPVNILTHCNAGWLATVDYGTATAPIYKAKEMGIPIHVWVDETRPRNQGAKLTAWELLNQGIEHTLIADNTGGILMQRRLIDLVIVGSDRTTSSGDVCNKVGTYLKALAAKDNSVPFYVALPTSSIDMRISEGIREINIEERDENEVKYMDGIDEEGNWRNILICPAQTPALNLGFDITPARLVTGIITELGICNADPNSIKNLFSKYI